MRNTFYVPRDAAFFCLILILSVLTVPAQQHAAGLRGQVVDQVGSIIVGATITIAASPGMERSTVTDNDGSYTFNGLQPGTYAVRADAPGFAPYENKEVNITASNRETLNISMGVELKKVEVDVDSSVNRPSLDPDNNATGIVLRGADLDAFSDDPDQLAEELQAIAGSTGPGGTQFYIDGFSGGRLPPKSSIREVRINSNPFSAEQDALGFGRVDIFTKPGTGKIRGQAFFTFSDESLNARNPLTPKRVPFQVRQYGGNINGPLGKKISFFVDVEKRDIDENAFIDAIVLDAALNPLQFRQAIVTPHRRTNFSTRFDFQLGRKHTVVARYSLLDQNLGNQRVGGFFLPSQALKSTYTEHTFQLTETAVLSATMINETRFQYVHSFLQTKGNNTDPTLEVQGAFIGGGPRTGLASNSAIRYELNNQTTWARETHNIKFGGRLRVNSIADRSNSAFNGSFVFSSLAQYQQVLSGVPGARPTQFVGGAGNELSKVNRVDFGVFAQDDWRVRPSFTLSYGLRFETQTNINDHVDFAPRLGFAWAPWPAGKSGRPSTVIRGGVGVFYNRFGEDLTLQADRFNGITQQQVIVNSPSFFPSVPPVQSLTSSAPQTLWRIAGDLKSPYVIDMALSLEQQLPLHTTLGITYIHEIDRHLLRSRAINAPLPGTFIPGVPTSGVRPLGSPNNIFLIESSGVATGDVVFFNLRTQLSKRISVFSLTRLFRERNNTEGSYDFPANSYDLSNEYGNAVGSLGPSTFIGANVSLPFGFNLSPLIRAASGQRFNIISGRDTNGDTVFTERPALASDLTKPGIIVTPFGAFDPNPALGQALIPRNFGKGPAIFFVNARLSRTFGFGTAKPGPVSGGGGGGQIVLIGPGGQRISGPPSGGGGSPGGPIIGGPGAAGPSQKAYSLSFSIMFQNIFNRTNFGPLIGNLSSPLFGQANSVAANARRIDLQVRFSF